MKKIIDFFKNHKYAIIWTACYLFAMWAILYFLFNFDMLNMAQWHKLAHAQLRGFAGFVFGLLLLAALPLYIATTTLIVRNKKPLITIPLPKIKIPAFLRPAPAAPAVPATPAPAPESETPSLPTDTPSDLSPDIPAELRTAYIRARNNLGRVQTSAFNTTVQTTPVPTSDNTDAPVDTLPVPPDFDITASDDITPDAMDQFTPTFTEISFDTPDTNDNAPQVPQSDTASADNSVLIDHLNKTGQKFTTDGDIIITDTHAIATHSDPDFWVADTDNWFAAGKVCPSPIIAAKNAATAHNVTPAVYLATTNILDIEKLIEQWRADGITIITDPSEL